MCLWTRKPKIVFSKHISKTIEDGKPMYRWKFYNAGKRYLKDIDYKMELYENETGTSNGKIIANRVNIIDIPFAAKPRVVVPFKKSSVDNMFADYAIQIRIKPEEGDLETLLKGDDSKGIARKFLEIQFSCKDAKGLCETKTFYFDDSAIKEGSFKLGNSVDII